MITDEMVERAIEAQSLFKINFDLTRELWVVFDNRAEPKIVFETTSRREAEDKVLFLGQRAALEAALAGAWRPINTAPRDGTVFLVPERPVGDRVNVQPCAWMRCQLMGELTEPRWRNPTDSQGSLRPSAWMPLPPPPVKEG